MKNILANFKNIQKKDKDIWIEADMPPKKSAEIFKKAGGRLISISGYLAPDLKEIEIYYHFDLEGKIYNLRYRTKNKKTESISKIFPTADWIEREIFESYGVKFKGHKNLTNLLVTSKIKTPLLDLEKEKLKKQK